jgi:hypothetical protein
MAVAVTQNPFQIAQSSSAETFIFLQRFLKNLISLVSKTFTLGESSLMVPKSAQIAARLPDASQGRISGKRVAIKFIKQQQYEIGFLVLASGSGSAVHAVKKVRQIKAPADLAVAKLWDAQTVAPN